MYVDRKATYDIDVVLNQVMGAGNKNPRINLGGDLIKMNTQRLRVFKKKGVVCAACGIEGAYFAKEQHPDQATYILNLYALDHDGQEVLMTQDHIRPIARGASKSGMNNLQPMRQRCNHRKGARLERELQTQPRS